MSRPYDVVVVGAGSAGCALAARLSEDPERSVLLLEAGPAPPSFPGFEPTDRTSDERLGSPEGLQAERSWTYEGDGSLPVVRGKGIGGSGAVNGAFFLRGAPEDYDAWGSPEWTYDALLPSFRRLEADQDFAGELHGATGPVPVERRPRAEWWPFHEAFQDAALELGFPEKPDLNHPEGSGVGPFPRNTRAGLRVAGHHAYLAPALGRPNLTVRPEAPATRVVLSRHRAIGVEVGGQTIAAGEVVLAAGAIESPHLLALSGIGPAAELRRAGIEIVHELPGVGRNLRDHAAVFVTGVARDGHRRPQAGMRHQNMLAYTATGSAHRNDMQLLPAYGPRRPGEPELLRIGCSLQLPMSAGELRLDPSNPSAPPRVLFEHLRERADMTRLADGLRLAVELLESDACRALVHERIGPTDEDVRSDAAATAWVARNLITYYHSSGTCKLGPASDSDAVTDARCRVHGIDNLRVADLSIAPNVVRANTNATAIAIGERAATMLQ